MHIGPKFHHAAADIDNKPNKSLLESRQPDPRSAAEILRVIDSGIKVWELKLLTLALGA
jgi:hypothetical protein